jgi:hypothetical protein
MVLLPVQPHHFARYLPVDIKINGSLSIIAALGTFLFSIGFALSPNVIVNHTLKEKWQ